MGNVGLQNTTRVTIRLTDSDKEYLEKYAKSNGTTQSAVLSNVATSFIEELRRKDLDKLIEANNKRLRDIMTLINRINSIVLHGEINKQQALDLEEYKKQLDALGVECKENGIYFDKVLNSEDTTVNTEDTTVNTEGIGEYIKNKVKKRKSNSEESK